MALPRRSSTTTLDIWPGFVDALATLLMVIIFLLMIFVVAQFFLNDALLGRDEALERLNRQVSELADLLDLERRASADLRSNVTQLSGELQASLSQRDSLSTELSSLKDAMAGVANDLAETKAKLTTAIAARERLSRELAEAYRSTEVDREKIEVQLRELAALREDIAAMKALRASLARDLAAARGDLKANKTALGEEKVISAAAKAQVAKLNRQLSALREQIAKLNDALEASEAKTKAQKVKIVNLGKRLNAALASKVQELARYRSVFFGRLRKVLGNRPDISIVGDRFVLQSEVLFASGSAELGNSGKAQMSQLATALKAIAARIPADINWVLRIDGHTDEIPITTPRFPTNWELSTARAISVVKFLVTEGIPPTRLAAAGFGAFQPLDARHDEIAYRRNRRIELKFDQR